MDMRVDRNKSRPLAEYERTVQCLLLQAAEWLGGAVRPLQVSWDLQSQLWKHSRRIGRQGIAQTPAIVTLTTGRRGHSLSVGLELREVTTPAGPLRVVWVSLPYRWEPGSFYAVATRDLRRFYRWVRQLERSALRQEAPLMNADDQDYLWQNTVGFLLRDPAALRRLEAPQKRGVLLRGVPGNGKTTACRWLRYECLRRGFEWKQVDHAAYESARSEGETHELFQLERPGIIVFDDFDQGLRDRRAFGDTLQTYFLGELDGLYPRQGVVYLFTTNLTIDELDPAALRPGRIDAVLTFANPDATLRRQLFAERWQGELRTGQQLDRMVADTEGWSFAELEEARKQLALNLIDRGVADWTLARRRVLERRREAKAPPIGFVPQDGTYAADSA